MPNLDPVTNFAKVTVSTTYDAAATSIALTAGHGAKLPQPSTDGAFNMVWWNSTDYADPSDDPNVEIVRVTARSTDTLTVTRAQESISATTKNTGGKVYLMILAMTKKMKDDIGAQIPAGAMFPWPVRVAPTGYLACAGTAVSRTTYDALFANIVPNLGTFTVTIASPAVLSLTAHNLQIGDSFYVTTTGALPTGMSANTLYYVISAGFGANDFQFSATFGGSAVNTSGSQSGVHTFRFCPFGLGDGSTTFNVPDCRGRTVIGADNIGGSSANRVVATTADALGQAAGAETHTLTEAEMPAHTHTSVVSSGQADGGPQSVGVTSGNTGSTGGGSAHNNMQPHLVTNWIIKT